MTVEDGCRSANSLSHCLVLMKLDSGQNCVHRPDPRPCADIEDFLFSSAESPGIAQNNTLTCTFSRMGARYSFPWRTRL
jgi:hypothetical protein